MFKSVPLHFIWLLLCGLALAQQTSVPLVRSGNEIPGAVQPRAAGQRNPVPLRRLLLNSAIPEIKKIEFASNGFIEVAHALILMPRKAETTVRDLDFAQTAVNRAFSERPGLSEVDFSVFVAESYAGAGGPLPRLTGSILKGHLGRFRVLEVETLYKEDRVWVNRRASNQPVRETSTDSESVPLFSGEEKDLREQQKKQLGTPSDDKTPGALIYNGNPKSPVAAMTFDDAPHPLFTPLLLDILRRTDVKATFFCVGRNAEAYPYFVRDMMREGHEIANHTYHHVRLHTLSAAEVKDELEHGERVLESITGTPSKYFRPPGGRYSKQTLDIAWELGFTTVFWTDDPSDFDNLGEKTLMAKLARRLRYGGIVLLHDNVLQSIEVLPTFLQVAANRGIHLGTVTALIEGI